MSVIVGRALPDVKDGLKPVHRRILYAMYELKNTHDKPYKKCARIVGEVLGKYHPHGDAAVYDALVRMAQDFSTRYLIIDGQGNFGSIDGDAPAAMRYTECRLSKLAEEMLADIEMDTTDFNPNFDGSLKEPTVLPAKIPNLLINGSSGIAVGMATNMPPHNICEIIDGLIAIIDNPQISKTELFEIIKGPDFPTGGIIYGIQGVLEAYTTGKGTIKIRAKTHFEEDKTRKRIVITELPYQVNKAELLKNIADLIRDKEIEGIVDLRDESDRTGIRIVVDLKPDAIEDVILNQLYANTQLEISYGIINLTLVDNKPQILSLPEILQHYLEHRIEVVTRRANFELKKATEREHILEGLLIALAHIDDVINLIKSSATISDAKDGLIKKYSLTELQAKTILEMRLQKLTALESKNIAEEREKLVDRIKYLRELLEHREKILAEIKKELLEIKSKHGDSRRTEIIAEAEEIFIEDLIPIEDVVVTLTNVGYIKRVPLDVFRTQRRGGKGLVGIEPKEEDYLVNLFITSTHNYVLFFTTKGKCYWLKAYRLPEESRYARGRPIANFLPLEDDEKIAATIPVDKFDDSKYLVFATRRGIVKKTQLSKFSRPLVCGIWAIKLGENDNLVEVAISDGTKQIVLITRDGKAVRFSEKMVRSMGRYTYGVRGIKLKKDDEVISMAVVDDDSILVTITEKGFGKLTFAKRYRKTRRGASGVIGIKATEKSGKVISTSKVSKDDELIVSSHDGMVIRIPVEGIRLTGRSATGVKLMKLQPKDKIMAVARITHTVS
jgi:DNA gyrase subunit A